MNQQLRKTGITATIVALVALAAPVQAQFGGFGGIVNDARRAASNDRQQQQPRTQDECQRNGSNNAGGQILGGILGRAANEAVGGTVLATYLPMAEFSDQISSAIACRLDPDEQQKAANATLEVTRGTGEDGGAQVGATTSWVSETREGVSGRTTVTGREPASGDGLDCIMVTDVIIVSGEETRADKRMCRRPPSPRYSMVA